MTLLLLFIFLVWLKIVAGTTIILFWLWFVRDRALRGPVAALNYLLAFLFWLTPWAVFVVRQSHLYSGHCGLRQGMHLCGMSEYLWTSLGWARFGFALDLLLLFGIVFITARAHVVGRDERSADRGDRQPPVERPA